MAKDSTTSHDDEPAADRRRVQLDLSPQAYARLVQLREKADAKTNAETIRNALRLYEWFLDQKGQGWDGIQLTAKNGKTKEVELVI